MIVAVSIVGALLLVVVVVLLTFNAAVSLARIANALDNQNAFYGIGAPPAVDGEGVEPIGTERTSAP